MLFIILDIKKKSKDILVETFQNSNEKIKLFPRCLIKATASYIDLHPSQQQVQQEGIRQEEAYSAKTRSRDFSIGDLRSIGKKFLRRDTRKN